MIGAFDKNNNLIMEKNESNKSYSTETSNQENDSNVILDSSEDKIPPTINGDKISDSSSGDEDDEIPQRLIRDFDAKSNSNGKKTSSSKQTQTKHKNYRTRNVQTTQANRLQNHVIRLYSILQKSNLKILNKKWKLNKSL